MSKLYFCKCSHFLLFLSLSTVLIPQFNSSTKIFTLIPMIPTPNSPHSHPDSSHSQPDSLHSRPDSPHSHHSSHSVPRFPIPAFTDSQIKSQSFLDFNNFFMYRLKKFFITTKQTLIKDVIKERNMEWLAERIEIR